MSNNSIRSYGYSNSGIDVDSVVTKIMDAKRTSYYNLEKKQTLAEYRKEAYNKLYTSMKDFNKNTVNSMGMQKTLSARTVSSSDASVASITASADAPTVTHSLSVTQLASGVTEVSTGAITTGSSKDTLSQQFGINSGNFLLNINGKSVTVKSTGSINDLVSSINNANADVTASYDTTNDRFYLYSKSTGSSSGIDFSGTSDTGLEFLTDCLKLNIYSGVDSTGATSTNGVTASANQTLSNQFGTSGTMSLQLNGQTVSIAATDTMQNVIDNINGLVNGAGNSFVKASYVDGKFKLRDIDGSNVRLSGSDAAAINFLKNQLKLNVTDASTIDTTGVASSSKVVATGANTISNALQDQFSNVSGSFSLRIYDGTTTSTISIDTSKSINDIITSINNIGTVTASFTDGKFTIKAKDANTTLDFSRSDIKAIDFLHNNLDLNITNARKGQDAKVQVDGVSMTQSKNQFTVAGISYNIKATGSTTASVALDTESVTKSVQSFIDSYNSILKSLNDAVGEEYDSDYLPLSSSEKEDMSENDISTWTAKAKTGILQNDSILNSISQAMQSALTNPVSGITGSYITAESIGIISGDWTQKGQLTLDTDKLTAALEADPDILYKIFGTTGKTDATNGVSARLNDIFETTSKNTTLMDQLVTKAGTSASAKSDKKSSLGIDINAMKTRLSEMNDKLNTEQERYYNQFTAMEAALSKLNSQTSYLTSLLSS